MQLPDLPTTIHAYEDLGMLGFAILAIVALVRRWIVPGRAYDEMKAERDGQTALVQRLAHAFDTFQRKDS